LAGSAQGVGRGESGAGADAAPLNDAEQAKLFELLGRFEATSAFSGPMPDPAMMAGYRELVPDAPERLLRIVEARTTDESRRLDRLTDAEIDTAKQGLAWAAFLAVVCISAAIVFFALRNVYAGTALLGFPVALIIRTFFDRHRDQPSRSSQE
jgi:hypothetical protein